MDVNEAIEKRRAYRSLESVEITHELIDSLAKSAALAPSCFNYQPWRFIFVHSHQKLEELYSSLSKNNSWFTNASMVIAVFSRNDFDCQNKDGREYFLFDTGMSVGLLILRATEMGLVAHPIAGFNQDIAKKVLNIPDKFTVITLIAIGKHASDIKPQLTEKQALQEQERPLRKNLNEFVYINFFK